MRINDVLGSKAIRLGYIIKEQIDGTFRLINKAHFTDPKQIDEYLDKIKNDNEVIGVFHAIRNYIYERKKDDSEAWGQKFDVESGQKYATETALMEMRNIIEEGKNRITRLSLRNASDEVINSNRMVLIQHERVDELIKEVNLYLEDGRYKVFDIKLGVSYHEHFSINIAILELSENEAKRLGEQIRINRLAEQNRCIECETPLPVDEYIREKCDRCGGE